MTSGDVTATSFADPTGLGGAAELRSLAEKLGDDYGYLFVALSYRWLSKDYVSCIFFSSAAARPAVAHAWSIDPLFRCRPHGRQHEHRHHQLHAPRQQRGPDTTAGVSRLGSRSHGGGSLMCFLCCRFRREHALRH